MTVAPSARPAWKPSPFARSLGEDVHAVTIGAAADGLAAELGTYGVSVVVQAHHDLLSDYGPEAWGETVAQLVREYSPTAVLASGTDRGNELIAQVAARLDLPMVANCNEITAGDDVGDHPCALGRLAARAVHAAGADQADHGHPSRVRGRPRRRSK